LGHKNIMGLLMGKMDICLILFRLDSCHISPSHATVVLFLQFGYLYSSMLLNQKPAICHNVSRAVVINHRMVNCEDFYQIKETLIILSLFVS